MNKNIVISVLALVAIVLGVLLLNVTTPYLGSTGTTHYQKESFLQGLYSGTGRQLSVSNVGLLTTSGGFTNSGTLTQSGSVNMTGTVAVNQSASSTLQIGSTASGIGTGCIVLGDSSGTTSTPVYITATGATISATTTIPDICR